MTKAIDERIKRVFLEAFEQADGGEFDIYTLSYNLRWGEFVIRWRVEDLNRILDLLGEDGLRRAVLGCRSAGRSREWVVNEGAVTLPVHESIPKPEFKWSRRRIEEAAVDAPASLFGDETVKVLPLSVALEVVLDLADRVERLEGSG